jgi:hypothetical protein
MRMQKTGSKDHLSSAFYVIAAVLLIAAAVLAFRPRHRIEQVQEEYRMEELRSHPVSGL